MGRVISAETVPKGVWKGQWAGGLMTRLVSGDLR